MNAALARRGPWRPALLPTLATTLLLALLLWLGFWQLERARQKDTLLDAAATAATRQSVPLEAVDKPAAAAARFQAVSVAGRYDGGRQILLDNQVYRGQPGYHVYTPLQRPAGPALLVNRGWVAAAADRRRLPAIAPVAAGPIQLRGRLGRPANPGLKLGPGADAGWPQTVQHIDYDALGEALGYPLLPAVLLLDPNQDQDQDRGLVRDWRLDFGNMTPSRHRGYAVQWFALALTLAVIYLLMQRRTWRR